MIFLPQDSSKRDKVKKVIEDVCRQNELTVLGWREVPVDETVLGPAAREAVPSMWQLFVKAPKRLKDDEDRDGFERTLYLVRRRFDVEIRRQGLVWDGGEKEYSLILNPVYSNGSNSSPRSRARLRRLLLLQDHRLQGHGAELRPTEVLLGPAEPGLPDSVLHLPPQVQHQHQPQVSESKAACGVPSVSEYRGSPKPLPHVNYISRF